MDENRSNHYDDNMDLSWLTDPMPAAPPAEPEETAPPADDTAAADMSTETAPFDPPPAEEQRSYQNPFAPPQPVIPVQPSGYSAPGWQQPPQPQPQEAWQSVDPQPGEQYGQAFDQQAYDQPAERPAPQEAGQAYHTHTWGQSTAAAAPPTQPPQKRKKTGLVIFSVFLVLLLCAGTVIGVQVYRNGGFLGGNEDPTDPPKTSDTAELVTQPSPTALAASNDGTNLTAKQIADKLKPSNVLIQVFDGSDSIAGEGSGILLMEDSTGTYTYIVTCAHVIDSQSKISVELDSGETYDAIYVAGDARTDVGLLKIAKTGLPLATFGDSAALSVGDTVYAIGNPGGAEFMGSMTHGIVSAIDRSITSSSKQVTIQHSAAINPGNSGGMLVNAAGQVVGINSQKIVDTQYEGMGFAVPSKIVQEVVNDLIKYGRVPNRPKLGIQYTSASSTQLGYYVVRMGNLPSGSVIIYDIDSDSSFKGTDVQKNDIITHVNGEALTKADVLLSAIENSEVGDTLKLKLARVSRNYDINEFEVTITLVEDKGTTAEESTTEAPNIDFFGQHAW